MQLGQVILMLSAGLPIGAAWWANRDNALAHTLFWGILAWLAWLASAVIASVESRYLALGLTACAGVAVLGARRPGVGAWNGAVVGLLAVLLLPLAQAILASGTVSIHEIARGFLALLLIVVSGNYLPTRLGFGALALLFACLMELWHIDRENVDASRCWPVIMAAVSPWLAAVAIRLRRSPQLYPADQLWSDFRVRFGVVWALRLQDQFNHSARNSGLGLELGWGGVHSLQGTALTDADKAASLELMVALLQRFGLP